MHNPQPGKAGGNPPITTALAQIELAGGTDQPPAGNPKRQDAPCRRPHPEPATEIDNANGNQGVAGGVVHHPGNTIDIAALGGVVDGAEVEGLQGRPLARNRLGKIKENGKEKMGCSQCQCKKPGNG